MAKQLCNVFGDTDTRETIFGSLLAMYVSPVEL